MNGRDPGLGWVMPGADVPALLAPIADALPGLRGEDLTRFFPPPEDARASAVLILLGESGDGAEGHADLDVLIIERAHDMRAHAGQPAFPGGAADPGDRDPIETALREAVEETGLDATGVEVFGLLPDLWVPVSNFVVTPVLAWWRHPSPVQPMDLAEVASVHRISVAELVDPANRARVRHPSGYVGYGFAVRDLLVWGFTAGLLTGLLDLAGWSVPWDESRILDLQPDAWEEPV